MRIEYDPEADALYIRFRDTKPVDNRDVEDGLTVDLDEQQRLVGIEILDVSHRFPPETLATITVQNLLTASPSSNIRPFRAEPLTPPPASESA